MQFIDVEWSGYINDWSQFQIYNAPTVEVNIIKHGKWITHSGCCLLKCSCCGYEYSDHIECMNFCGNCGAMMEM